jgi:hypothetical protein
MAQASVVFGGALVMLGAVGYVLTDMVSLTALIPSAFGLVIILFGIMAMSEARRKLAMHLAMGVALLGILGSFTGLIGTGSALVQGAQPGAANISRALMAVLLLVYLTIGVRSFVAARRR